MFKRFPTQKLAIQLTLGLLVVAGVTTAVAFSSPQDGPTMAGNYEWIQTARAQDDARQAYCDANFGGDPCVELCVTTGGSVTAMDSYCCLDGSLIGDWDSPEECTNWVPSGIGS